LSEAMPTTAHHPRWSTLQNNHSARQSRRRREHLRHIHPMSREQQLALIEEARAARRAMQQVAEAADARVLTIELDREWAYGNGWK
jgi:hypothetical protein